MWGGRNLEEANSPRVSRPRNAWCRCDAIRKNGINSWSVLWEHTWWSDVQAVSVFPPPGEAEIQIQAQKSCSGFRFRCPGNDWTSNTRRQKAENCRRLSAVWFGQITSKLREWSSVCEVIRFYVTRYRLIHHGACKHTHWERKLTEVVTEGTTDNKQWSPLCLLSSRRFFCFLHALISLLFVCSTL